MAQAVNLGAVMRLDVPPIAWHCLSASKHVQQKLSFSISYPLLRSSASRFSLGALFRFLSWKNRTKCLQGTFDLKFFPPDFSGCIFQPALPSAPVLPCPPSAPAMPASAPASAVRVSRPRVSVRQPARASACASPRQPSTSACVCPRPRPRASPRRFMPAVRPRQIKAAPIIWHGRAVYG